MFGIGYFRYAPGTAASFVTCIIFYLFWISNFPLLKGKLYIVCILLIILVYSIIITDKLSYLFKKKDPKEIVIDEFIGQSIPLTFYFFQGFICAMSIMFSHVRVILIRYWFSTQSYCHFTNVVRFSSTTNSDKVNFF